MLTEYVFRQNVFKVALTSVEPFGLILVNG